MLFSCIISIEYIKYSTCNCMNNIVTGSSCLKYCISKCTNLTRKGEIISW